MTTGQAEVPTMTTMPDTLLTQVRWRRGGVSRCYEGRLDAQAWRTVADALNALVAQLSYELETPRELNDGRRLRSARHKEKIDAVGSAGWISVDHDNTHFYIACRNDDLEQFKTIWLPVIARWEAEAAKAERT